MAVVGFVAVRRAEASIARLAAETMPWREMAREFAAPLRSNVGFDCFALCQLDPIAGMPAGGFADDHTIASRHRRYWQIEYQSPDFNKLDQLVHAPTPVATLGEATQGNLARSRRWAELFGPCGLGDELRAVLVIDGLCWGSLSLHRERRSPSFTERDAASIGRLVRPIAAAARAAWALKPPQSPPPRAPGTLLVSGDGQTIAATDSARQFCLQLDPIRGIDSAILSAMAAKVSPATLDRHASSLRSLARGIDGSWIQLNTNRLDPPVGDVSSVLTVQPAVPEAVTDLLMHAHALTPRECQVVKMVLAGASNADIAANLFLSRHTVSDHLKSIFTKTGVHTRHELALCLAGIAT